MRPRRRQAQQQGVTDRQSQPAKQRRDAPQVAIVVELEEDKKRVDLSWVEPPQQPNSHERLSAMNKALADYGNTVRNRSAHPAAFVPFEHMPGNSADPLDESVCWKPLPSKPAGTM